jgi:hypothetical protein
MFGEKRGKTAELFAAVLGFSPRGKSTSGVRSGGKVAARRTFSGWVGMTHLPNPESEDVRSTSSLPHFLTSLLPYFTRDT